MNPHFCRVGRIKANVNQLMSLKDLENRIANFVDDVTKVEYSKDWNEAI